jgi:hypothetical protein
MPIQTHRHRRLFQVNRHVQASLMLLSVMDGAELDMNKTILSPPPSLPSTSDDFEKGLTSICVSFFSSVE